METKLHICNGCCCGHEEKGNPKINNELFSALLKNHKEVTIEKPYCLGPCSLANVVQVDKDNTQYMFMRINDEQDVKDVVTFIETNKMSETLQKKQIRF